MRIHVDRPLVSMEGPLQAVFNSLRRSGILGQVQTLILDGLSVTSELVRSIICDEPFNVRIHTPFREVQHLNQRKLQQALHYAIRPSRAPGTPKLEALYIFGPKDSPLVTRFRGQITRHPPEIAPIDGMPSDQGDTEDQWYQRSGEILTKPIFPEWASTVLACKGIISFDAVLCNGPRHRVPIPTGNSASSWPSPSTGYWIPQPTNC